LAFFRAPREISRVKLDLTPFRFFGALVLQRSATSRDAKQQRESAAKLLRVSR
jgi:hypothetical protein